MLKKRIAFPVLFLLLMFSHGCSSIFKQDFEKLSSGIVEDVIFRDVVLHIPHRNELLDYSPEAINNWFGSVREYQHDLQGLHSEKLREEERISFEILQTYLARSLLRDPFRFHDYPITHLYGPHLDAPRIFERKKVASKKQVEAYLYELNEIEPHFGGLIDGLELRRNNDIILPTFILEKVIAQCDSLGTMPAVEHPFYLSFERKLRDIGLLEPHARKEFLTRCKKTVSESIIPAYKRLAAYLRQLELRSVSVAGVWQLPKGDDYYRFTLRYYCGTENDPAELYQIGKMRLAAIEGELKILDAMLGSNDPQIQIFDNPTSSDSTSLPGHLIRFPEFEEGMRLFAQYAATSSLEDVRPREQLIFLRSDQLATAKLMTDVGIHHKQWLREQAVEFLQDHSYLSEMEAQRLVDQIIVRPGVESAGKVSFMRLRELQGDGSANEFLKQLQELGPMPLNVLEKHLKQGVEKQPS